MTESRSSVYSLITGLAGGAAVWTGVEILLWNSASFPDLRTLSLSLGGVAGLLLGAVVPTAEGLRQNQPRKVRSAILVGALTGLVFGALGMAAGQLLLSYIAGTAAMTGSRLVSYGAALARIPGWMILGMAVGGASGIRSRSIRRVAAGALGGLAGGLIGGLAAEALSALTSSLYGRLAGMLLWGAAVAVLADGMERRRARGRLTVLNGPLKGRSFPVNQNRLMIAHSGSADLTIPGDSKGNADRAVVIFKRGAVMLRPSDDTVLEVNGVKSGVTELRYDDVIKIGETTMIYEAKR